MKAQKYRRTEKQLNLQNIRGRENHKIISLCTFSSARFEVSGRVIIAALVSRCKNYEQFAVCEIWRLSEIRAECLHDFKAEERRFCIHSGSKSLGRRAGGNEERNYRRSITRNLKKKPEKTFIFQRGREAKEKSQILDIIITTISLKCEQLENLR